MTDISTWLQVQWATWTNKLVLWAGEPWFIAVALLIGILISYLGMLAWKKWVK